MPKVVTEIERREKRHVILDPAAEIACYGYDRANINIMAERAGIGHGTIYLNFNSKKSMSHQQRLLFTYRTIQSVAAQQLAS